MGKRILDLKVDGGLAVVGVLLASEGTSMGDRHQKVHFYRDLLEWLENDTGSGLLFASRSHNGPTQSFLPRKPQTRQKKRSAARYGNGKRPRGEGRRARGAAAAAWSSSMVQVWSGENDREWRADIEGGQKEEWKWTVEITWDAWGGEGRGLWKSRGSICFGIGRCDIFLLLYYFPPFFIKK